MPYNKMAVTKKRSTSIAALLISFIFLFAACQDSTVAFKPSDSTLSDGIVQTQPAPEATPTETALENTADSAAPSLFAAESALQTASAAAIATAQATPKPTAKPTVKPTPKLTPKPTPKATQAAAKRTAKPRPKATPKPTAKPTPATPPSSGYSSSKESMMIDLVNGEREKAGLPALKIDSGLRAAARKHSADMSAHNFFSHTSPTYGTFSERLKASGVSYGSAGENIAMYGSVEAAHEGLMNSSGHRANILNTGYTRIGIGIVYNSSRKVYYITQWFAR